MDNSKYAPIVVFVYRRLEHTKAVIEALKRNAESQSSDIYIFSDAPKDIEAYRDVINVREYLRSITGFNAVNIIERKENWGIEKSEIDGITRIVEKYGKVIVIEDDIVVSSHFLQYVNKALIEYENEKRVFSVTGYSFIPSEEAVNYNYAFTQLSSAWGWATWKDRWDLFNSNIYARDYMQLLDYRFRKKFDFGYNYSMMLANQIINGYITWDIAWYWASFINGCVTLFPTKTMVNNIGMDGSGVHYNNSNNKNRVENLEQIATFDFPNGITVDNYTNGLIKRQLEMMNVKNNSFLRKVKFEIKEYICVRKAANLLQ